MMRYNTIRKMDISNGPGVRASIFLQGCAFHCEHCFNPETWSFDGGKAFTEETLNQLMQVCKPEYIVGLSILGGEPMHPQNRATTLLIAQTFKKLYPSKNLWVWSGYTFEEIKTVEALKYIDVLVDGRFIENLHDFRLKFRGSANQRIIDVKKSLTTDQTVIIKEDDLFI